MDDLDRRIKDWYRSNSLSEEQLEQLVNSVPERVGHRRRWFGLAAAVLVLVGVGVVLYAFQSRSEAQILDQYASEIAYNHRKGSPVEIASENVADLNQQMDRLNFELQLPAPVLDSLTLQGGRYCSVDEHIAAQLKMESARSEVLTFYVFRKEVDFDFEEEVVKEDVAVQLWDAGELVYGLARTLTPEQGG